MLRSNRRKRLYWSRNKQSSQGFLKLKTKPIRLPPYSRKLLARLLGVSRAKITQMLNLLKLDDEIQGFILGLDETDKRLKVMTERRLRPLAQIHDENEQLREFRIFRSQCDSAHPPSKVNCLTTPACKAGFWGTTSKRS